MIITGLKPGNNRTLEGYAGIAGLFVRFCNHSIDLGLPKNGGPVDFPLFASTLLVGAFKKIKFDTEKGSVLFAWLILIGLIQIGLILIGQILIGLVLCGMRQILRWAGGCGFGCWFGCY